MYGDYHVVFVLRLVDKVYKLMVLLASALVGHCMSSFCVPCLGLQGCGALGFSAAGGRAGSALSIS